MKKEKQTDTGYPHLLKGANDLVAVFQTPENLLKFLAEATRWHACFKFKSRENDYGTYISIMMEDVIAAWYRNSDGFLDELAAIIYCIKRGEIPMPKEYIEGLETSVRLLTA